LSKNYPHVLHSSSWKDLDGEIPVLRRFLSTRCRDDFESDDVIQETLLRAARYRRHLHNPEKMRAWILSIARNVLSDRYRRERRLGRSLVTDDALADEVACPSSVPEVQTITVDGVSSTTEEVLSLLDGALEKLKRRDRDVVSNYYGGAMSCRETAESCDLPIDLVKVRLFRARNRLRKYVQTGLSLRSPEERAGV
jgi:RNA polymerase sigma-70 factor (ECF subfamily)